MDKDHHASELYWLNEATLVGFSGLAVISLFLSMQMMEIFYYMCVMTNAILYISNAGDESNKKKPEQVAAED